MSNRTRLSKFISLILRHRARDFGLQMDSQGFVDYARLRSIVEERSPEKYTDEDWQIVLAGEIDGKKRFELVDGRIRALYGHSRVEAIIYPPVKPPEFLYHGTTPQALPSIRRNGLRPMKRQYVHLSANIERAQSVGGRRTENVIILKIKAREAQQDGLEFFNPEPEHFLARNIPPHWIEFPEV